MFCGTDGGILQTLESFYILHRVTGDSRWREHGWSIFESIVKETKTAIGFASIRNVQYSPAIQEDEMPR
jgi:mannosyl-oligosaccharide alpha-1,2-mannosidase